MPRGGARPNSGPDPLPPEQRRVLPRRATDWPGMLAEPMTRPEWLAHLRELPDDELDELCGTSFERERDAARDERDRRIDAGVWRSDA